MLAYSIVRLAHEVVRIEARDDKPWEEARAFTFHNVHGVKISMTCA